MSDDPKHYLTLGWQVTPTLEPTYWLKSDAKPGLQKEDDLVRVPSSSAGSHTAIIAQSGSGKSFFLGRLIEELVLNTKARCLILDPNADFRQIHRVEETVWTPIDKKTGKPVKPHYDLIERGGKLPHEKSREDFEDRWPTDEILIKGIDQKGDNFQPLKLWWPDVSVDFFSEGANPVLRSELYYCHTFVKELALLIDLKAKATKKDIDLLDLAETLLNQSRKPGVDFYAALQEEFADVRATVGNAAKEGGLGLKSVLAWSTNLFIRFSVNFAISRASKAPKYVTPEGQRFYFATVNEYNTAGILETKSKNRPRTSSRVKRVEVIDLPALPNRPTQLLAINAILKTEWELARKDWSDALGKDEKADIRVPTFIVVDEAHNLMPAEPESRAEKALRDQFRTIIAEGRKYGLFLILVSQRPDKLDPLIVSECENKVLMKLSSRAVLDKTRSLLGLEDIPPKLLDRCLEFELGRALLLGTWVPRGPQFMYSAPRRTKEGGRNLRKEHWAVPPVPPDPTAKKKPEPEADNKDKSNK